MQQQSVKRIVGATLSKYPNNNNVSPVLASSKGNAESSKPLSQTMPKGKGDSSNGKKSLARNSSVEHRIGNGKDRQSKLSIQSQKENIPGMSNLASTPLNLAQEILANQVASRIIKPRKLLLSGETASSPLQVLSSSRKDGHSPMQDDGRGVHIVKTRDSLHGKRPRNSQDFVDPLKSLLGETGNKDPRRVASPGEGPFVKLEGKYAGINSEPSPSKLLLGQMSSLSSQMTVQEPHEFLSQDSSDSVMFRTLGGNSGQTRVKKHRRSKISYGGRQTMEEKVVSESNMPRTTSNADPMCVFHPKKRGKYVKGDQMVQLSAILGTSYETYCSKCALDMAQRGFRMSEIIGVASSLRDQDDVEDDVKPRAAPQNRKSMAFGTDRKKEIEAFLEKLGKVYEGAKGATKLLDARREELGAFYARQCDKLSGVVGDVQAVLDEERAKLGGILTARRAQNLRTMDQASGQLAQLQNEMTGIREDIERNFTEILTSIKQEPYNAILAKYNEEVKEADEGAASMYLSSIEISKFNVEEFRKTTRKKILSAIGQLSKLLSPKCTALIKSASEEGCIFGETPYLKENPGTTTSYPNPSQGVTIDPQAKKLLISFQNRELFHSAIEESRQAWAQLNEEGKVKEARTPEGERKSDRSPDTCSKLSASQSPPILEKGMKSSSSVENHKQNQVKYLSLLEKVENRQIENTTYYGNLIKTHLSPPTEKVSSPVFVEVPSSMTRLNYDATENSQGSKGNMDWSSFVRGRTREMKGNEQFALFVQARLGNEQESDAGQSNSSCNKMLFSNQQ
eukprot:TRINITY_DN9395_c0_g1_i2.p1 TRINITY_DN9395_c0_g1~~TRINITY_DN9395_c0_g1_i2.p1  ORF type:complete len:794 (+),score=161.22 TRINITY_DN9395_c0_g1_i2:24-2405(+)